MSNEVLLAWRCMLQQMGGVTYFDIVIRTKEPSDQQCRITDRHILTEVDNRLTLIVQFLLPCKTIHKMDGTRGDVNLTNRSVSLAPNADLRNDSRFEKAVTSCPDHGIRPARHPAPHRRNHMARMKALPRSSSEEAAFS